MGNNLRPTGVLPPGRLQRQSWPRLLVPNQGGGALSFVSTPVRANARFIKSDPPLIPILECRKCRMCTAHVTRRSSSPEQPTDGELGASFCLLAPNSRRRRKRKVASFVQVAVDRVDRADVLELRTVTSANLRRPKIGSRQTICAPSCSRQH